ncbi:MAG: lipoyl(octanoyl) transferase LipB [Hyphomicrobiaceae bacterium]
MTSKSEPSCDQQSPHSGDAGGARRLPFNLAISDGLTDYAAALRFMEHRAGQIARGEATELVWLVEHPPLYTAGTSAKREDLLHPDRFPVFDAGRGGQYTYHGPGQRVAYVMLDVKRRFGDVRRFVCVLERTVIRALAAFNITGEVRPGRIGVWVARPEKGDGVEDKIAAIGIRLRRWVSFHGLAINVDPDLSHFGGIVPCGIADHGVTSFEDLGRIVAMPEVDMALIAAFEAEFGAVQRVAAPALA